jgi:uncharacterized protein involved in exopolysaccharide biosynthesis
LRRDYHYRGQTNASPIDIKNINPDTDKLRKQRDEKAAMVRELRQTLEARHARGAAAEMG